MTIVSLVSSITQMALVVIREVSCTVSQPIMANTNHAMIGVTTQEKPMLNQKENEKYKAYMTMNKLIEEAEKLYKEIDSIQMIWVASTKDNDEEGKRHAIGRMSVAMCNAMQLLKYLIERKDNIVDLSEVWHDNNAIPDKNRKIIAV